MNSATTDAAEGAGATGGATGGATDGATPGTTSGTKRVPIRRKARTAVLIIMLAVLAVAVATSLFFMRSMIREGEDELSGELQRTLGSQVEQKASKTNLMFESYERYIVLIRDYLESMYKDRDAQIASGSYFDTSRATTPEGTYAMQSGFTHEVTDISPYLDDIYFFSNLEPLLEPIAKENDELIATIYLGTTGGLLVSYDKWSSLAPIPEPGFLVYDYTQSSWYSEGMERDDVFFTGMYADSMGRGLTITTASPFKNQAGEVQGVLAADFYVAELYNEMVSMNLGNDTSSFAIDKNGKIISNDSEDEVSVQDYTGLGPEDIAKMTSGEIGILEKDDAFYAYAPVERVDWTLCAKVPRTVLMGRVARLESSLNSAMLSFSLIAVVLMLVGMLVASRVTRAITRPIEQLVDDMRIIANGNLDHKALAYRNDEIGDMTNSLNDMVARLKSTMHDLVSAQNTAERMHELANMDGLTGMLNKTAYDRHLRQLEDGLSDGQVEFGFVMIDLNFLKKINDTYGHERGDLYIKKLCGVLREVFDGSPVFRIGGDEFAVILTGDACGTCAELVDTFDRVIADVSEDDSLDPWERTSAAAGFALYDEAIDNSVADVFRRADIAMYERKRAMKAIR